MSATRGRTSRSRRGSTPLSPMMAAQERRRVRRRRLLLWGTLPVWGTVLVLGLILMVNVGVNSAAIRQFDQQDYAGAADDFENLDAFNLVERWKAPFNLGTTRYVRDDLWGAMDDLDHALNLVPDEHRCMVQTNRALVFEAWGDLEMEWSVESAGWAHEAQVLVDAGTAPPDDAPWGDQTPDELLIDARMYAGWAEGDYAEATEARQDPTCSSESESSDQQEQEEQQEQQEQNQESQDRLEQKESEAAEAAQDPAEEQQPAPTSPQQAEEQRQEELDQRNAEAAAQADADRQEQADAENESQGGGSGDEEGYGGSTKNW